VLKPEHRIVEVGLGGRFDSTRILPRKDILLTSIGEDHVEVLGHSRLSILAEKLALAETGSEVYVVSGDMNNRILAAAERGHYKIHLLDRVATHPPKIHRETYALARGYLEKLHLSPGSRELSTLPPGRFSKILTQAPTYYDVAHNPLSFSYLAEILSREESPPYIFVLVLGRRKPLDRILGILNPIRNQILLAGLDDHYDYHGPYSIPSRFRSFVRYFDSVEKAGETALELQKSGYQNATGSRRRRAIVFAGTFHLAPYINRKFGWVPYGDSR